MLRPIKMLILCKLNADMVAFSHCSAKIILSCVLFLLWLLMGCRPKDDHILSASMKAIAIQGKALLEAGTKPQKVSILSDSLYSRLKAPTMADRVEYLNLRCEIYKSEGHKDRALHIADSAISLLEPFSTDKNYSLLQANSYFRKGEVLFQKGSFRAALRNFYTSRKLLVDTALDCGETSKFLYLYHNKLAEVWLIQKNYPKAIHAYKESLKVQLPCHADQEGYALVQTVMDNIGICYTRMNRPDSALYYYNLAIKYIKSDTAMYRRQWDFAEEALGVVYGNRGEAEVLKGNYARAITDFKESIRLNLDMQRNVLDARYTQLKLADVYIREGNFNLAEPLLEQVKRQLPTYQDRQLNYRFLKVMSAFHQGKGNFKAAFDTFKQASVIEAELEMKVRGLIVNDLSIDMEAFDRQLVMRSLDDRNKMYALLLIGATLFLTACCVILFIVLRSKKRIRKYSQENMQRYRQLQLASLEIEEHNKNMKRIMGVVAHDMRSPIAGIGSLSDLLLQADTPPDDWKAYLKMINVSGKRLLELIEQLLQWNIAPHAPRTCVNLAVLVDDCRELLTAKAQEKNQSVIRTGEDEVNAVVNEGQIWRVINNLLVNAIKFSPNGSEIYVKVTSEEGWAVIRVTDQGIGIPETLIGELFEPISSAQRPGTDGEPSHGLGLYISKQILEAHQGEITVSSEVAKGSVFTVRLPLEGSGLSAIKPCTDFS